MHNAVLLLVSSLPLVSTSVALAGGEMGNGGDVVQCTKSSLNGFDGYYSLDYILTLQNGLDTNLREVGSFSESRSRITDLIQKKCKSDPSRQTSALGDGLATYFGNLDNFYDWTKPYIWLNSAYGLVNIKDERMIRMLPENCLTSGKPNVIQAVIRKQTYNKVVFEFDPKILESLRSKPLQQSFLLLHEALWNYTDDIDHVRWSNHFFHSISAESLSQSEFHGIMINFFPGRDLCSAL